MRVGFRVKGVVGGWKEKGKKVPPSKLKPSKLISELLFQEESKVQLLPKRLRSYARRCVCTTEKSAIYS